MSTEIYDDPPEMIGYDDGPVGSNRGSLRRGVGTIVRNTFDVGIVAGAAATGLPAMPSLIISGMLGSMEEGHTYSIRQSDVPGFGLIGSLALRVMQTSMAGLAMYELWSPELVNGQSEPEYLAYVAGSLAFARLGIRARRWARNQPD